MPDPGVLIAILAAGSASRMRGGDKVLERVDGRPNLARLIAAASAAAEPGDRLVVALPPAGPHADPRAAMLNGTAALPLVVADAAQGMGHSIAAVATLAQAWQSRALMLVAADMPGIGADEIAAVRAAHDASPDRICRGTDASGRGGHPVLFPARYFDDLAALTGDAGAKALIARDGVLPVPLPGDAATLDLDTPEEWAAWRGRGG